MGSRMKEDQSRVSALIQDTVTLLCKNGLIYKQNMKIQGLLGITLDDDEVFIIHLNQVMESCGTRSEVTESKSLAKKSVGRSAAKRPRPSSSKDPGTTQSLPAKIVGAVVFNSDVQVKSEPDTNMLEYSNVESRTLNEGLALEDDSFSATDDTGDPQPKELTFCDTTATSADQPFVTGMIVNQSTYDPGQHSGDSAFPWVGNAAQGSPGVTDWASQMTQQNLQSVGISGQGQSGMSQHELAQSIASHVMSSQPGMSQPGGLPPGTSQSQMTPPTTGHQRQPQSTPTNPSSHGPLKKQQFQKRWPTIWPWLEYDTNKKAMFCKYCVKEGKINAMTKGCQSFKTSSMMRHEALVDHKASMGQLDIKDQGLARPNPDVCVKTDITNEDLGLVRPNPDVCVKTGITDEEENTDVT